MHSKGVSPFGDLGARSRMSTPSGAHVDALDEQLNQADRLRREQLFSTLGRVVVARHALQMNAREMTRTSFDPTSWFGPKRL
jgi:hypothetical protein